METVKEMNALYAITRRDDQETKQKDMRKRLTPNYDRNICEIHLKNAERSPRSWTVFFEG